MPAASLERKRTWGAWGSRAWPSTHPAATQHSAQPMQPTPPVLPGPTSAQRQPAQAALGPLARPAARPRKDVAFIYAHTSYAAIVEGLGKRTPDQWMSGDPSKFAVAAVARLRESAERRIIEVLDSPRLHTALRRFDTFLEVTERRPFICRIEYGDVVAFRYNADTLLLFLEYLRTSPRLRGEASEGPITSNTLSGYVGSISRLAAVLARTAIVADSRDAKSIYSTAAKHMRQDDAPSGQRALCAGLRITDFQEAARRGYPRMGGQHAMDWAAALAAHNLVLRGGEVGVVDDQVLCEARDITPASIVVQAPCEESDDHPWLTTDVVPIKDTSARAKAHRLGIRRRSKDAAIDSDPVCAYDAVMRCYGQLSPAQRTSTAKAFFTKADGTPMDTTYVLGLARAIAQFLDLDPQHFGAKSFRIGGATDWAELLGAGGRELLQKRGRWDSDCDQIYARILLQPQLAGSGQLGHSSGRDLERVFPGFVQSARRFR